MKIVIVFSCDLMLNYYLLIDTSKVSNINKKKPTIKWVFFVY